MRRFYELTYLVSSRLEEKEVEEIINKVKETLTKLDGEIYEEMPFYKTRLGYPINKEEEAYLVSLNIFLLPDKVKTLQEEIKKEPKILRHIIFKKKLPKEGAQPSQKAKPKKPKKVELKELDKKLEEILK